jgi:hypothetical protein
MSFDERRAAKALTWRVALETSSEKKNENPQTYDRRPLARVDRSGLRRRLDAGDGENAGQSDSREELLRDEENGRGEGHCAQRLEARRRKLLCGRRVRHEAQGNTREGDRAKDCDRRSRCRLLCGRLSVLLRRKLLDETQGRERGDERSCRRKLLRGQGGVLQGRGAGVLQGTSVRHNEGRRRRQIRREKCAVLLWRIVFLLRRKRGSRGSRRALTARRE